MKRPPKDVDLASLPDANPLCACGCGHQVSYPWHRYVLGHVVKPKLSKYQMRLAVTMEHAGWTHKELAEYFGVSTATICYLKYRISQKYQRSQISDMARKPCSKAEIEEYIRVSDGKKQIRAMLRDLVKHRAIIRERLKWKNKEKSGEQSDPKNV